MSIEKYIERILNAQSAALKARITFSLLLVGVGLLLLALTYSGILFSKDQESLKVGTSLISALLLSITTWPVNEIMKTRNSIRMFVSFQEDLKELRENQTREVSSVSAEQIHELIWKSVEKMALG